MSSLWLLGSRGSHAVLVSPECSASTLPTEPALLLMWTYLHTSPWLAWTLPLPPMLGLKGAPSCLESPDELPLLQVCAVALQQGTRPLVRNMSLPTQPSVAAGFILPHPWLTQVCHSMASLAF